MVCVKMTSQGAQIDDGQDKPVVILPPKDQRHAVTTGGLPMVQMRRAQAGLPVQTLPHVKGAPPQIQGPQPGLSSQRVVRVAAPKQVPLPPVPEFPADQLMLCRYLLGKYLTDLRSAEPVVSGGVESAEASSTEGAPADPTTAFNGATNVNLAEAAISTIDQALVAVAVRAEAEAAASLSETQETQVVVPTLPTAPAVSIIPAAPTASYVAGRVGDRPHGYAGGRVQRNAAMAPRRVARPGALPPVIVKMENGRSVVQNQAEVAAVRAAVAAQGLYAPDGAPSESPDGNSQG